jgi:cellulose biosynthesis protein BcsQ
MVDLLLRHIDSPWQTVDQNRLQEVSQIPGAARDEDDRIMLDATPPVWAMLLVGLNAATSFVSITAPVAIGLNRANQLLGLVVRVERIHPTRTPAGGVLGKDRRRPRERSEHTSCLEAQLGQFPLKSYLELHTEVEKAKGAQHPLRTMPGDVVKVLSSDLGDLPYALIKKEAA